MVLIAFPASLAKSRSRTSCGGTAIRANASLSSLVGAAPTCEFVSVSVSESVNESVSVCESVSV